jgi:hypothetical protein
MTQRFLTSFTRLPRYVRVLWVVALLEAVNTSLRFFDR